MAYEIKMPQLGLTMEEGTVCSWMKKVGDAVAIGDVLLEITTDKLTSEITSEAEGVLLEIVAPEGEDVPVMGTLGWIKLAGEKSAGPVPAQDAMPEKKDFPTVIVVGGGPGGYVAAIRAAQLGARVTVVEKQYLGGTCLNVGCIPTKCLLHTAELLEEIRDRGASIGIKGNLELDFEQLMRHKNAVSQKLTGGIAGLMRLNKIKVIDGEASFSAPGVLAAKAPDGKISEMRADAIILAVGSVNAVPPIPGMDHPCCIDSTRALSLDKPPKSMAVIGGGVVGMELACAYAAFGTKVTIFEMMPSVLPMLDEDIAQIGVDHMRKMGVDFHMGAKVLEIRHGKDGNVRIKVQLADAAQAEFDAEKVLMAVGRRANTAALNLDAAGIHHDRGRIIVNERMETNLAGVYAIGDCVLGYPQLAHVASVMGEVAAENICGKDACFDVKTNPSCIFIMPEAASVGFTEKQCIEKGLEYRIGRFPFAANGKALIAKDGEGMVKLIIGEKYGEILGMHIIGPRASDMIALGALAIGGELTADELIDTIFAHPSITETVREAALHSRKRAIHIKN